MKIDLEKLNKKFFIEKYNVILILCNTFEETKLLKKYIEINFDFFYFDVWINDNNNCFFLFIKSTSNYTQFHIYRSDCNFITSGNYKQHNLDFKYYNKILNMENFNTVKLNLNKIFDIYNAKLMYDPRKLIREI